MKINVQGVKIENKPDYERNYKFKSGYGICFGDKGDTESEYFALKDFIGQVIE